MVDLTFEAMSEMQQLKDMGFGQSEAELAMQQANGQADFKPSETGYTSIRTTMASDDEIRHDSMIS